MNKGSMMKKTILAMLVGASVSLALPVMAETEARPTATSNLTADQQKMVNGFITRNNEINELSHQEKILELEAKLEKLKLEKAKAEKERDEIINGPKQSEIDQVSQKSLESDRDVKSTSPLDSIYITKIYGLDSDLKATVYYKGMITQVEAGDQIDDGIHLIKFVKGGAVFAHKKETKRVSLTTGFNAYAKTFEPEDDEDDEDDAAMNQNGMARPFNIGPNQMMR